MRPLLLSLVLVSLGCSSTVARRTDQLVRRYEMYGFTGSVLVAESDRVVLDRNYGVKERAFDVGSIMKTVVAAAALELQNDGKLRVVDPIGKYLDGLPPDRAAITIHELLLHTSGLPLDDRNPSTPLGEKKYSYSNVGYGLLADIVERAAGMPFRDFARQRLLVPAGMRETSFWGEPSLPAAPPFTGNSDEELAPAEPLSSTGKYTFGAAGMITTTRDLHRWWRFVDRKPGTFTEQIEGQAYGWNVRRQPDGTLRHYRGGLVRASYMSMLSAYRARDIVLIWMMNKNTGWHEPLTKSFERIMAGQPYVLPPAVVRGRDDVRPEYVAANARLLIERAGDDLLVAAEGQQALSIVWALGSDERVDAMNAEVAKKDPSYELLGTGGHSSSTANLQTFVRGGGEILRFISDGRKILATGKGYPGSAKRRFRRTGAGRYALYDQRRDAVVTLTVRGDEAVLNDALTLSAPPRVLP
jgi:CubicO group peptidase (beta-lactamase class C family)